MAYEAFVTRMNTPSVMVDNSAEAAATVVKLDSSEPAHGILLDAVQALSFLGLDIKKGYVDYDGRWFMDSFHVTDLAGAKIADEESLRAAVEASLVVSKSMRISTPDDGGGGALTAIELAGTDRPGLLSEVFAVLAEFGCGVVEGTAWTHNGRAAAIAFARDEVTGQPIFDAARIGSVVSKLRRVLKGHSGARPPRIELSPASPAKGLASFDRRLHRLMFEDRDYELRPARDQEGAEEVIGFDEPAPDVSVDVQLEEKGYTMVVVKCDDRPKLLFDVLCALTDLECVVFHGRFNADGARAYQEFYIRHRNGTSVSSDAERQRVALCLQAAVRRRVSTGVRMELRTPDRRGLLAYVTRTFRENGLSVTHADIATRGDMAMNVFYVAGATDPAIIELVRDRIGREELQVEEEERRIRAACAAEGRRGRAGIFNLVRRLVRI